MADADHHVYVLECADGSLYTGYTTDVERRVAEHNAGDGAKYTRGRTPVELVHSETFGSRSAAMRREHEIKQRSRAAKERLVYGGCDADEDADADVDVDADADVDVDPDHSADADVDYDSNAGLNADAAGDVD